MRCVIVSGGEYSGLEAAKGADFVIACDKGYEYAKQDGIRPDLILGDFDSYGGDLPADVETLRLPVIKDDTDTLKAVRIAVSRGFDEIDLCCGLGNRLDHLFANLQTAAFAAENGAVVRLFGKQELLYVFAGRKTGNKAGEIRIDRKDGWSLSVFSLSDHAGGVCIRGAFYELENAVLSNRFPVGVSNEWKEDSVRIGAEEGILLVMLSRLPKMQKDNE